MTKDHIRTSLSVAIHLRKHTTNVTRFTVCCRVLSLHRIFHCSHWAYHVVRLRWVWRIKRWLEHCVWVWVCEWETSKEDDEKRSVRRLPKRDAMKAFGWTPSVIQKQKREKYNNRYGCNKRKASSLQLYRKQVAPISEQDSSYSSLCLWKQILESFHFSKHVTVFLESLFHDFT